jgi:hypothetical protein
MNNSQIKSDHVDTVVEFEAEAPFAPAQEVL